MLVITFLKRNQKYGQSLKQGQNIFGNQIRFKYDPQRDDLQCVHVSSHDSGYIQCAATLKLR